MMKGEHMTIVGDGEQRRDFTHIEDTISAIMIILKSNKWNESYNINTGKQYSILEIAKMFGSTIQILPPVRVNRKCSTGSNKKLKELGWKPRHNIVDYIKNITRD